MGSRKPAEAKGRYAVKGREQRAPGRSKQAEGARAQCGFLGILNNRIKDGIDFGSKCAGE